MSELKAEQTEQVRTNDTDYVTDPELPAMPDEEAEAMIQTSKIREMTVRPGVMKVPVDEVTTAHNSAQWVVEMDHPVEDDIRFFLPKPRTGWTREYKLVRLLDWYGIAESDADVGGVNVYDLQIHDLYIEYDDNDDEWTLIRPPGVRTRRERLREWIDVKIGIANSIDRTAFRMFGFIQFGIIVGAILTALSPANPVTRFGVALVAPFLFTVLGLLVTDP